MPSDDLAFARFDTCADNSERERLAGHAAAVRTRLEAKRATASKAMRPRNIDLVIKHVISEDNAEQRIAGLKGRASAR